MAGFIGWALTASIIMKPLLESTLKNAGFGVIVLAPILFIAYSIISIIISGVLGIVVVSKIKKYWGV